MTANRNKSIQKALVRALLALLMLSVAASVDIARADQIVLKSGIKREGIVLEQNEKGVKINMNGIVATVPWSQIESLQVETPTPTAVPTEPEGSSGISVFKSPTPSPTVAVAPTPASLVASATMASATGPRERFGAITAIKGKIRMRKPGGEWEEPRVGAVIFYGDELQTAEGRVQIIEKGKWDVRTLEGTSIHPFKDERGPGVDLFEGKVWNQIEKLEAENAVSYRVRTPNAVAGVRGTLFAVEHKIKGESRLAVYEGQVDASGEDTVQQIRANQAALFAPGSKFIGLSPAPEKEREEFDFWDDWQAEVDSIGKQFPIGGEIISAMGQQIAAENKLAEHMLEERKQAKTAEQVGDALDELKSGIVRYKADFGKLPADNLFWQSLMYNIDGTPQWKGPYIPAELTLPIKDRYGSEIKLETATSATGKHYLRLVSPGPNKRYNEGGADDIISIVTTLDEPVEAPAPGEGTAPQPPGVPPR